MTAVFADTAFYVAAASPRDELHQGAVRFLAGYRGHTVTTEFVLAEVANFFTATAQRQAFADLVRGLRSSRRTQIVGASSDLFERGLKLFESRPDKQWSLIDCTSFVVMGDRGLTDALASDRHFTQAGFRALLIPAE
jgi:predicted nucleic acid-binding protein